MRWSRVVVSAVLVSVFATVQVRAENVSDDPTNLLQPIMSISTGRPMAVDVAGRIVKAVASTGANADIVSFPTLGLTAHTRGTTTILRLKDDWRIPTATMIAPLGYLRAVGGDAVADAVAARGSALIGRTAASIRNAKVGDVLELRDAKYRPVNFRVAAIVPDSFVDWGELYITTESATVLGTLPISRIDITEIRSPSAITSALRAKKIALGADYRLRTSWDRPNPDGTLGTATTKKLLGEFAFRPTVGSSIVVSSDWVAANISWSNKYKGIPLRNNCHKVVAVAIQGALTEIKNSGLAPKINVRNSNNYGGCFVGRYNRSGGTFGAPSRHAWGMALDINTDTNPQGGPPALNCDVVRIFRKWGFSWGGNYLPADGMHFEYVGQRRDQIGYPSRYCRNKVAVPSTTLPPFGTTTTTTTVPESTTTTSTTTTSTTTTSTTTTSSTTTTTTLPS